MKDIKRLANQFREAIEVAKEEREFYKDIVFRNFPIGCCGDKYLFPNFMNMLDVFKQVVSNKEISNAVTDFDWLFIAQHYGLPTPLLDCTTDFISI